MKEIKKFTEEETLVKPSSSLIGQKKEERTLIQTNVYEEPKETTATATATKFTPNPLSKTEQPPFFPCNPIPSKIIINNLIIQEELEPMIISPKKEDELELNLKKESSASPEQQQQQPIKSSISLYSSNGYSENSFEGKEDQMSAVCEFITKKGFIPLSLVTTEVAWFYNNLGIDNMYFAMESIDIISSHIMSLYAAKMIAYLNNANTLKTQLEQERPDGAVYIHNSKPGISNLEGPQYEQKIDDLYLDKSFRGHGFRLESYRSSGVVASNFKTQLRCYFVRKCCYKVEDPLPGSPEEQDIHSVSDSTFLHKATPATLSVYEKIMKKVLLKPGPVIEMHDISTSGDFANEKRLIIGYRQQSTQRFFSSMSDLYHYYELFSVRKYVENFSNGVSIMCLYLSPLKRGSCSADAPPIEHSILQIMREASLIFCLPSTPLSALFRAGTLSVQESMYGYNALVFAQHFLNRLGPEYASLAGIIDASNPVEQEILSKIKKRLRQETFTREYVLDIVLQYPDLIRVLYVNFAMDHYMALQKDNVVLTSFSSGGSANNNTSNTSLRTTLSFQRLQKDRALSTKEIFDKIKKVVGNKDQQMVFEAMLSFNEHILKTNFFSLGKVAISFRLDPAFLPVLEYPIRPFGMFLVIGSEFRGFHVRFSDIARGGIRIIKSRDREAYSINSRSLFDENYNLAFTQQRKNKDIPEGGSKGTILLNNGFQDKSQVSFHKYVDSILDLLLLEKNSSIVDRWGMEEILFFGPDEGSADYMDWASLHAKQRGASFWKAFATGKSQSLGGIPHDLYGMTTTSIHSYVSGIYRKLSLLEDEVTKFQTGGPDGDLGSNEILMSSNKTLSIVDGSGVIYDPLGLDREEIERLAKKRKMIVNFDKTKLSPQGFRVLVDDVDIVLPDGTHVDDGIKYRNEFHLNPLSTADLFVPCGGRPEAVDINNVHLLMDPQDPQKARFKYIVEGANLFFTQDARQRLEAAGVLIFKDASANKGGVTSSSLEVLAALSLNDEEFEQNMQIKQADPSCSAVAGAGVGAVVVPPFYKEYVSVVQEKIRENADNEFEAMWREAGLPSCPAGTEGIGFTECSLPLSMISDQVSVAILDFDQQIKDADMLWDNEDLRMKVLGEAIPSNLQKLVPGGLATIISRLPLSYSKALFSSCLSSRFIYRQGTKHNQVAFYEFMSKYQ